MTKTQLISAIHERMEGSTKTQVKEFLEALKATCVKTLAKEGSFTFPDLVKVVLVKTSAKPERLARNPATGATIKVAPKAAGKKLKARFVKFLKGEVGQVARSAKAVRATTKQAK